MSEVYAILVSDIHLSLKAPRCRHGEPDWTEVQRRQLDELKQLAEKYHCPVLAAGDIFDRWNAPAELIRFALDHLPDNMIAVAGNHDLPYHNLDEVHRSAFGVLHAAGKIRNASYDYPIELYRDDKRLLIWGRAWGEEISERPREKEYGNEIHILLSHKYVAGGTSQFHTDESELYRAWKPTFDTYDIVHLGDNHTFWHCGNTINPGSFFRRTVSDSSPTIGLVTARGIRLYNLVTPGVDIIDTDVKESVTGRSNALMEEFVASLRNNSESRLDFQQAVRRFIEREQTTDDVIQILAEAMEHE